MADLNDFMKFTKQALEQFANQVVLDSKKRLIRKSKYKKNRPTQGALYKAIDSEVKVMPNSFIVKFPFMQDFDYAKYLDQGVKGKSSTFGNTKNSPFRFGTGTGKKGGLTNDIEKWVKRKRFQFREDNTGRFMSYKTMTFLISRSVYQKGIPAKFFFTKSFNMAYEKLPNKVIESFALDVKESFKKYTIS
jgi:hypothetical protein